MKHSLFAALAFAVVLSASASAATQPTATDAFALTDVTPAQQLAHDGDHKCGSGDH